MSPRRHVSTCSATAVLPWHQAVHLGKSLIPGASGTNRTCDPPLRRGMLYPLSYGGEFGCGASAAILTSIIYHPSHPSVLRLSVPRHYRMSEVGLAAMRVSLKRRVQAPTSLKRGCMGLSAQSDDDRRTARRTPSPLRGARRCGSRQAMSCRRPRRRKRARLDVIPDSHPQSNEPRRWQTVQPEVRGCSCRT